MSDYKSFFIHFMGGSTLVHQHTVFYAAIVVFCGSLFGVTAVCAQALPPTVVSDANRSSPTSFDSPTKSQRLVADGEQVLVKGFTFSGNSILPSAELERMLAHYANRMLDMAAFDAAAELITARYQALGYSVARAFFPSQKSKNGVMQIHIYEGRIGALTIKNSSAVQQDRLFQTMTNNLCEIDDGKDCISKLIHAEGLERALLTVRDMPGITATMNFKPSQTIGASDLEVEVKDTKRQAYTLGIDNFGLAATGVIRLNANADMNNLRGDGDQLSLALATTTLTHTQTGGGSYQLPVGYEGQRVGLAFSRNQYRLGAAGFSTTQSHGISNALSVFTAYPVVRSIAGSLYARLSGEVRGGVNNVEAASASYKTRIHVVRLGLNGDHADIWGGGGFNLYGFTWSSGFSATNDPVDSTASGAQTAGSFYKLAYNFERRQTLTGSLSAVGTINGQRSVKNLDGSEQIGLGGPASVRGYSGEAGGSTGASGMLELRYSQHFQLGEQPSLAIYGVFMDRGWVQLYQYPPLGMTDPNTRALSSYGATLTVQSQPQVPTPTSRSYFLRAMYGKHSAMQPSSVDPTSKSKLWLQAGMSF